MTSKKLSRSVRGKIVDFDLLAIKQQLTKVPVVAGVNQRRKFIDEKDGVKTRQQVNHIVSPPPAPAKPAVPDALALAAESAEASAKVTKSKGE